MSKDEGKKYIKVEHIGGWPKFLSKLPKRQHPVAWDQLGTDRADQSDETDGPFDINLKSYFYFMQTQNIYGVLTAFVKFQKLGLYPPPWVIEHLANVFKRHLANPDPDLLAFQLGISGEGSGAQNPYHEFTVTRERNNVLTEMMLLMSAFRVSFSVAAKAMIEKYGLGISAKRLMNNFRDEFGDPKQWMLKHHEFPPIKNPLLDTDEKRRAYLAKFPRDTLIYLKKKTPDIT